ncbi:hypothetical protein BKA69DRAFT_1125845 [Paraphysoderma sedebokerense]|nr:hypothetical protein BKA69DRAFT_1125845 [Paraphysoderma sedebokerense]
MSQLNQHIDQLSSTVTSSISDILRVISQDSTRSERESAISKSLEDFNEVYQTLRSQLIEIRKEELQKEENIQEHESKTQKQRQTIIATLDKLKKWQTALNDITQANENIISRGANTANLESKKDSETEVKDEDEEIVEI